MVDDLIKWYCNWADVSTKRVCREDGKLFANSFAWILKLPNLREKEIEEENIREMACYICIVRMARKTA